jgi:anti-sigma regulatory factor (Ser/Thr protein kinase)
VPAQPKDGEPDVTLRFGHDLTAARKARSAVDPLLREGGEWADDVRLVASELVTNVVRHTDDGGRLDAWDADPLVVEVTDPDRQMPAQRPTADASCGRGLAIVDQLADEWGTERTETGKVVWARFKRPRGGPAS